MEFIVEQAAKALGTLWFYFAASLSIVLDALANVFAAILVGWLVNLLFPSSVASALVWLRVPVSLPTVLTLLFLIIYTLRRILRSLKG